MLLKVPSDNTASDIFNLILFNEDVYMLIFRLLINLFFMTVIIRFLYYPISKRKDYLFSYYLIGIIIFFLCFGLKKMEIDNGMGFALFAIFGIIRYRTDAIEIKEMTYLFLIIGMSVINSLASNKVSISEMAIVNMSLVAITYGLERVWLLKHETRKTVVYERIDLIQPDKSEEMKADLETRTGLNINRVEVGKIDFLNDTAQVRIYYFDDNQAFSDYSK
ncbi:DUF4956 domain-containing protein [Crocinitomicaceae bacterium]|nr:DUF4956 domain-containing protein [Crocinitomicaceae bacterium]